MLSNVTRLKSSGKLPSGKRDSGTAPREQTGRGNSVVYRLDKRKPKNDLVANNKCVQENVHIESKQAVDTPRTGGMATGPRQFNQLIEDIADHQSKPAFAALFKHFAPRVKSFALKGGIDDLAAEEIAQETMLVVWRKAALFDGRKAAASTWIFTIARNKRVDYLRRHNKPALQDHDFIHLETDLKNQDESYEVEQASLTVREQMSQLPEDQKAVIIKAFMEEKSHAVVAEEMGLPLGTVKSRIRIALRKMRGKIGDQL